MIINSHEKDKSSPKNKFTELICYSLSILLSQQPSMFDDLIFVRAHMYKKSKEKRMNEAREKEKDNILDDLQIYILSFPPFLFSFTRALRATSKINRQHHSMESPDSPSLSLSPNSNGWFRQEPYFAAFSNSTLLQRHHASSS